MLTDIMMQAAEEFEKQMSPKSVSEQLEEAEREAMAKEAAEKEAATREKQAEPSAEISDDLKPSEHEKPPAEDDISKPLETEQTGMLSTRFTLASTFNLFRTQLGSSGMS